MAIRKKIQKKFHADFESKNKMRRCLTEYKWETQFQEVYTNSIFKLVQDNIERMKYCFVQYDQESQQVGIEKYNILETKIINNFYRRNYTYVVEYRRNGEYLECNYRNVKFKVLLCCHIFEVMGTLCLKSVNERYIWRRWRKDVVRKCSSIFFSGGYLHMTDEYKRYQGLEKFFLVMADFVIGDGEKTEFAKLTTDAMDKSIENWSKVPANNADEQRPSQVNRKRSSQVNENTSILNP
ncbi:hypothetical protein C2S52_020477 [Perilla frutescens var. hirtella]|nr:hypothetical protein C2S52_020477 [Perilla frutescens var. hirtella]